MTVATAQKYSPATRTIQPGLVTSEQSEITPQPVFSMIFSTQAHPSNLQLLSLTKHFSGFFSVTHMERKFRELADRWISETAHLSTLQGGYEHPAHLRIISMGEAVVPLILAELPKQTARWFVALEAITGERVADVRDTFDEAISKWLDWGRSHGLVE
jgi:hypothetical protein